MVYRIEIPSNSSYVYIDIRPPPQHDFWNQPNFGNAYGSRARSLNVDVLQLFDPAISSAVRCDQIFMKRMSLDVSSVEIGFLLTPNCMMAMARSAASQSDSERRIVFSVNLERTELELQFPFEIITMSQIQVSRTETLRFQTPFTNIGSIREIELTPTKRILILQLQSPPTWYKKMRDIRASMETDLRDNTWNAYMAWERQTDVVDNISRFRTKPIQLHKPDSLLDLGRWLTFHVAFELNASNQVKYEKLCEALQDWNLKFEKIEFSQFKTVPKALCHIWDVMDGSLQSNSTQTSVGDLLQISRDMKHLTFKVRYQLEVCVSKGCLNEYNLTDEFLRRLGEINPDQACASLERIADRKLRLYNPMDIFPMQDRQSLLPKSLPGYCILSRSCNITPTSILWNTPVVETSNRVIRQYYQYQDRFLRVRFTDEIPLGRVYSRRDQRVEELFARITQVMNHGIILGDRHYEFLAFGNSQFREHGAYFFASLPNLKAEQIRSQLGNLKDIRTAAKWCARLGQNFSTTRAIRTTVMINDSLYDVERNGFNFTDGVGKISKFLAQMIADELRLPNPLEDHPSLFQFRLGGCKGVLAVAPEIPGQEIHIRPSQYKFPAKHHGLEIVRTSQFVTSTLNRQIIVILSALGVKDEVFLSMMQKMIDELEQSMSDKAIAMRLLQKNIDINQCTLVLASMILNGFMDVREPFMISMLRLWKSWNLKYLKEKAKIYVSNGAHLMGCVDEYGVLKGHFNNAHVPEDNLPEIFVKIDPERNGIYQVLEGMCLLARSPSLHPGDVRVVRAVNKPELQHLKNVVVFPQNGDRDIPGMCSGGDVDGDDYLIIWDQALLPREWNLAPMDFTPEKPAPLEREVVVRDVTNFFVQYIKNDNLPVIASAHLCWADHEQAGVKSQKCILQINVNRSRS
jgi:RNA-dependent RNA polymerase